MRSDYPLYLVATICFIVAVYAYTAFVDTTLYIYALAVLGIVFIGLGYIARPKSAAISPTTVKPIIPPKPSTEETPEVEAKEETKKKTPKKRARKKKATRRRKKAT